MKTGQLAKLVGVTFFRVSKIDPTKLEAAVSKQSAILKKLEEARNSLKKNLIEYLNRGEAIAFIGSNRKKNKFLRSIANRKKGRRGLVIPI